MDGISPWVAAVGGLIVVLTYGLYLKRLSDQEKQVKPKPAVVNCPDCGGKVSTKIKHCPHCGRPME